jgi:glycolate oxidase
MCCVKYGVTSHHVRALTVVLSSGEVITVGKATKKFVTTLDLMHLFIGSEGTLGIVTEITLNIVPRPKSPATLIATFPSISQAAAASTELLMYRPSMLEIIDQTTLKAVEAWHPLGFEVAGSILLMQLDENFELGDAAVATCESHGMIDGMFSTESSDAADLIRVRKLAYPALERLGATLLDDVALPITKIAEFVGLVEELAAKHQLTIGIFGHAGDGNMHPTIVHDHGDIEGENPLYLPQAKVYDGAAGLGPCILVTDKPLDPATVINMEIFRDGNQVFQGDTQISQMKRTHSELVHYLTMEMSFPYGTYLMTGTCVVPDPPFTLQSGDEVLITIEPIGTLKNIVL